MTTWSQMINQSTGETLDWSKSQPWARAMADCKQDAQWHAEGDVWTHTEMVCRELELLTEWPKMNRRQQLVLLCTGLFHDSGKPATTVFDEEARHTRSPHHASAGVKIARHVLRELECDVVTREEICAMVAFHGRPPYLLEKPHPDHEVIFLSWLVNNWLLYLFTLADTRGRHSTEMTRPEENLDLWKLAAEEQNCFYNPFPFANDQARFLFYRDELSSLYYVPHEDYRCTMTMVSGLPGAGKDTWLAIHRSGMPVVSLDSIRAELEVEPTENQGVVIRAAREQCREKMRQKQDFAFNATNLTRQLRRRWIDLAHDYGARIEIVYIEPPLAMVLDQNKSRSNPVPDRVIN
jgi:putative nucleotidyltransferase with HDIG domain